MLIRKLSLITLLALTAAYPVLVFVSLNRFDPRWLLLFLAGAALIRALWQSQGIVSWVPVLLAMVLLLWGRKWSVLYYPVLVNGFFLLWFTASLLWFPPPVIERLARLMDPDLPPEGVRYTRKVTWLWCGFFLFNGALAAYTAVVGDLALWTWYNGLVAYLLMAGLMAGEYLVRRRYMRINGHV